MTKKKDLFDPTNDKWVHDKFDLPPEQDLDHDTVRCRCTPCTGFIPQQPVSMNPKPSVHEDRQALDPFDHVISFMCSMPAAVNKPCLVRDSHAPMAVNRAYERKWLSVQSFSRGRGRGRGGRGGSAGRGRGRDRGRFPDANNYTTAANASNHEVGSGGASRTAAADEQPGGGGDRDADAEQWPVPGQASGQRPAAAAGARRNLASGRCLTSFRLLPFCVDGARSCSPSCGCLGNEALIKRSAAPLLLSWRRLGC